MGMSLIKKSDNQFLGFVKKILRRQLYFSVYVQKALQSDKHCSPEPEPLVRNGKMGQESRVPWLGSEQAECMLQASGANIE
jgi:hypothetical protein